MTLPIYVALGERGKQHALAHAHVEALRYYREAMRIAEREGAPELFLRHFTQCALESLEHMKAYDEVLATCERAREHYEANPPSDDVSRKDRGSFLERAGVVLLRQAKPQEALRQFEEAVSSTAPIRMPLSDTLVRWLRSGLHVSPSRLDAELARQHYWSVRPDTVRADWAAAAPGLGPSVFSLP